MTQVDLITGFLGAGKTTFLLDYAKELARRGERIGIIENDYGAINVDLLLLHRELGDSCRLEMVIGGDPDCHRRRLKTKLIAMGVDRYDRVLVEPSGIFDVDEFLDLLYEEPLERLMSLGNVIAVVDAEAALTQAGQGDRIAPTADASDKVDVETGLHRDSAETRYVLAEELTKAGCVVFSKAESLSGKDLSLVTEYLNACLEEIGCRRKLTDAEILRKKAEGLMAEDFDRLLAAGSRDYAYVKRTVLSEGEFRSVFFFHPVLPEGDPSELLRRIFEDPLCGKLARIKGFTLSDPSGDGTKEAPWLEINATREKVELRPSPVGQPVIIAIGENLDESRIGSYWASYENEYRG